MHEIGIMQEAIEMACAIAVNARRDRVQSMVLSIGSLSGVEPDSLEFAFQAVSEGTAAAGARLTIERVQAACWCDSCQAEFLVDHPFCECPRCGQPGGALLRGREVELTSVEIS